MPKILALDIETKPTLAYVWKAYDENVGYEQIVTPGSVICVGAKWVGEKDMLFYSDWQHGHTEMLSEVYDLLCEADAVVTFNGDRFDLPILQGEFALAGFDAHPPLTSIDVLKTVKKFRFIMNRLAFVGPLLGAGQKMKHQGFDLWAKVMDGDSKAEKKMERYCKQDVVVLEKLYKIVRPFIYNHPHLGVNKTECGACGSNKTHKRGFRRTKHFIIQRLQCNSCGSWSEGARKKI